MTAEYDLFPPFSEPTTSQDAAESVARSTARQRARVYAWVVDNGGATCDEVEVGLDMRHQAASARLWELEHKLHVLVKTTQRRTTRSGRHARVYALRPQATTP